MKHYIILVAITAFSINGFAQSNFEGKIELTTRNTAMKETADIDWFIKDGQHRLDFSTVSESISGNYSLISNKSESVKLVSEGSSEFVKVPSASLQKGVYDLSGYYLTEEKDNQKVFSFTCRKATIQAKEYTVEYWLCDDTGLSQSDFPSFMRKGLMAPLAEIAPKAIPIKIQVKDLNGNLQYAHTISEIEMSKVEDGLFD